MFFMPSAVSISFMAWIAIATCKQCSRQDQRNEWGNSTEAKKLCVFIHMNVCSLQSRTSVAVGKHGGRKEHKDGNQTIAPSPYKRDDI